MKNKITESDMMRLQNIADKLQYCGYGGSGKNSRSADGDAKLLRKIIALSKPQTNLPVQS